ncbi:MAG TPA: hypothetical protein DCY88_09910 [Cyanobacteria bacterium UBA11372]|nr:hypothetical protein [Cyanobacteria bacterium UBA11372]
MYSPLAFLVVIAWFPFVFYLFQRFPAQQAVVISFITGWLFLPTIEFPLPGIPDITKMNVTCYSILLVTLVNDVGRVNSFKLGWVDWPMLIWCLCPVLSSLTNDLGLYDGLSSSLDKTMTWGIPYFLGRIYLGTLAGMRQMAMGIFIGGLAYVPFCLLQTRLSFNVHELVYGYADPRTSFMLSIRYGSYRPAVFMESGLMVGIWMMTATLVAIWLWQTRVITQFWGIPMNSLVLLLLITFVLVKATGAYLLLVLGVIFLYAGKWLRTALPVFLLILGMSFYIYQGVTGTVPRDQIEEISLRYTNEERTQSLTFRIDNEELLAKKARERIMFGWGGFGRNRVYAPDWKGDIVDVSITDSLWIITFGINGLVGLVSLTLALLLPPASLFILRYPASTWSHPKVAPAVVLAICLPLYELDCILNAMTNPIFAIISGALSALVLKEARTNRVTGTRSSVARRSLAQARQN